MQNPTKTNGKKIPKLRFKEFSGEWEVKMLGDCLNYIQPTQYLVSSTDYNESYSTPVLTAGKTFILGYTNEQEGIFNKNLPVIIFDDFTTATKFVDFPFKAKSSAMKILIAKDGISIKFIYECMQMIQYEIGGHERHWISKFSELFIDLPSYDEQQKIATFLTAVDKKLEQLKKKKQLLEQYKKGVMQHLFTQKLRFKGFSGEWEEKRLGEIAKIKTGSKDLQNNVQNGKYPFFVRSKYIERIDNYSYDEEAILIPGEGNIGDIYHYINGKFECHQRVYMISQFKNCDGKFIYYLLLALFKKQALKNSVKATVDSLRLPTFTEFEVKIPSLFEQKKIAAFLTALDTKIEHACKQIEQVKQWKKGLLQKMFV